MFEFLPVIFRNLFHRPATRNYPAVRRAPYPGVKGHVVIQIDSCIFCGMCMRKCPTGAIRVARAETTWTIDRFRCVCCNACVETCPKKCLSMDGHRAPAASRKTLESYCLSPEQAALRRPPAKPAAASKEPAEKSAGTQNRA